MVSSPPHPDRRDLLAGLAAALACGPAGAEILLDRSPRPPVRPDGWAIKTLPGADSLVARANLGGKVAFAVADARTGAMLETRTPLLPLPPASVAKSITALYAMDRLGAGHRFRTQLVATGPLRNGRIDGDLILAGTGDPTLDTDALADMAARLKAIGLREVAGRFRIMADALPRLNRIDPSQPDHVGYNPGLSGLNLNFNRVYFEWKRQGGGYTVSMDARAVRYRPQVDSSTMRIIDRKAPTYTYADKGDRDDWTVARGALGKGGGRWLPVRHPEAYAAEVFQTLARSHGIDLRRGPDVSGTPQGSVLVEHNSAELRVILRQMLKWSTNVTAEIVGLSASGASGATGAMPGSLRASGREMSDWLADALDARRAKFVDHSGLGDASRLTAHDMTQALVRTGTESSLRGLLKEIPIRDSDGRVIKGHPVKVAAKTGTLNFVSGLSGYLRTPKGRDLAFAIFCADIPRREGLSRAERERPKGGRSYNRRARALQNELLKRWGEVFDA